MKHPESGEPVAEGDEEHPFHRTLGRVATALTIAASGAVILMTTVGDLDGAPACVTAVSTSEVPIPSPAIESSPAVAASTAMAVPPIARQEATPTC